MIEERHPVALRNSLADSNENLNMIPHQTNVDEASQHPMRRLSIVSGMIMKYITVDRLSLFAILVQVATYLEELNTHMNLLCGSAKRLDHDFSELSSSFTIAQSWFRFGWESHKGILGDFPTKKVKHAYHVLMGIIHGGILSIHRVLAKGIVSCWAWGTSMLYMVYKSYEH